MRWPIFPTLLVTALWASLASGQPALPGHGGPIRSVAADDAHIVSGSFDGTALVWPEGVVLRGHDSAVNAVALLPDHPPAWLRWRGQEHRLTAGAGLERIMTAWWGGEPSRTRDYFKVQTEEGCWLWVFRATDSGRWFVHGLWT